MIIRIDIFLFQKRQDGQQPVLLTAAENIGEKIDHLCRIVKDPALNSILTKSKYMIRESLPLTNSTIYFFMIYEILII
jgi:hypothetical protein